MNQHTLRPPLYFAIRQPPQKGFDHIQIITAPEIDHYICLAAQLLYEADVGE